MTGTSKEISERVATFIYENNLNTYRGGIVYEGKSSKGTHYWAVDMGTPRTLDGTVQVFNKNFIISNINGDRQTHKSEEELMIYLKGRFKNE